MSDIRERIAEVEPNALFLSEEQFDPAIMGLVARFNINVVCYDMEKVLRILRKTSKMSGEEAQEYFDFNIIGAYMGDHTPAFFYKARP